MRLCCRSIIAVKVYGAELIRALRQAVEEPQRLLLSEREWVPISRVKRVSAASVQRLVRNAAVLQAWRGAQSEHAASPFVLHDGAAETFDVAANLFLKMMVENLGNRMAELLRKVRKCSEQTEFGKARLRYFDDLLVTFQLQVDAVAKNSVLTELKERAFDRELVLPTMLRHPAYARFYRTAMGILQPQFRISSRDGEHGIPSIQTYQLYEYWVFFRLVEMLQEIRPGTALVKCFSIGGEGVGAGAEQETVLSNAMGRTIA